MISRSTRDNSHHSLQWGRVLMNAETFHRGVPLTVVSTRGASMGPRSHERGNVKRALLRPVPGSSTCSLQWGRVLMNAETRVRQEVAAEWLMRRYMLQWGRVLMNAETGCEFQHVTKRGLEPMLQWGRVLMNAETPSALQEPLQWGRVLMNAETRHDAQPRSFTRFNGAAFS